MATYFHGNSEIQAGGDGLHTLILMNHAGYVGFSDTQTPPPSNFVFLNSNTPGGGGGHSLNLPHAPPSHTQQFVGIPLSASAAANGTPSQDQQQDISALHGFLPRVQYNLYGPAVDLGAARDISRAQQGLSLSLSSQHPGYGSFRPEREVPSQPLMTTISPTSGGGGDDVRVSGGSSSSASGISNGVNGMQSVIFSSKYLKAAQELLDEVVNVGKGVKSAGGSAKSASNGQANDAGEASDMAAATAAGDGQSGKDNAAKRGSELSTAERQEIQMKKAKLVNMLDEVSSSNTWAYQYYIVIKNL